MQPFVQYPPILSHIELLHVSHLSSQLKPEVPKLHSVRKTQIHNVPEKERKNIIIFVIVFSFTNSFRYESSNKPKLF
jgi:hypothetical protein